MVANALSRQREEYMDVSTIDLFFVEGADFFLLKGPCLLSLFLLLLGSRILRLVMRLISLSRTSFQLSIQRENLQFSFQNGLVLYKGQIFLGAQCGLKPSVLWHVHDGPLGAHSGYLKTLHRLKQRLLLA